MIVACAIVHGNIMIWDSTTGEIQIIIMSMQLNTTVLGLAHSAKRLAR